jgi:hypothetical protein
LKTNHLFAYQKYQFGNILDGRLIENVYCFIAISDNLLPYIYIMAICGHLVHVFHFGMMYPKKSGNPGTRVARFLLVHDTKIGVKRTK